MLKKRSSTTAVVPTARPIPETEMTVPPRTSIWVPERSSAERVESVRRETSAIDASASPRKPRVRIAARSSARSSLLVAWRRTESRASSRDMPWPSSWIRIDRSGLDAVWTAMSRLPASRAFSISSLATAAGRSITSPARIFAMT